MIANRAVKLVVNYFERQAFSMKDEVFKFNVSLNKMSLVSEDFLERLLIERQSCKPERMIKIEFLIDVCASLLLEFRNNAVIEILPRSSPPSPTTTSHRLLPSLNLTLHAPLDLGGGGLIFTLNKV